MGEKRRRTTTILCDKCLKGTFKHTTLAEYDFQTLAGLPFPVLVQRVPGLRCTRCVNTALEGRAIDAVLDVVAFTLCQFPYLLPGPLARFLRKHLDLTQDELATTLGVDRVTVAKWETDAKPISPQHDSLLRARVIGALMQRDAAPPALAAEVLMTLREQAAPANALKRPLRIAAELHAA